MIRRTSSFALILSALLAADATLGRTLTDLVTHSSVIAEVRIGSAAGYEAPNGALGCGAIYDASVSRSFKGTSSDAVLRFRARETLLVGRTYLIFANSEPVKYESWIEESTVNHPNQDLCRDSGVENALSLLHPSSGIIGIVFEKVEAAIDDGQLEQTYVGDGQLLSIFAYRPDLLGASASLPEGQIVVPSLLRWRETEVETSWGVPRRMVYIDAAQFIKLLDDPYARL